MSHQIKDFMTKEVNTIDYNATVTEAARIMASNPEVDGYVIVLQQGKPVGIVTERDIIHKVIAPTLDPVRTRISKIMSAPLITISPEEAFLQAPELMHKHNVNKIVVVKDDIIYGTITAKIVALQCGAYVNNSIREVIKWSSFLGI